MPDSPEYLQHQHDQLADAQDFRLTPGATVFVRSCTPKPNVPDRVTTFVPTSHGTRVVITGPPDSLGFFAGQALDSDGRVEDEGIWHVDSVSLANPYAMIDTTRGEWLQAIHGMQPESGKGDEFRAGFAAAQSQILEWAQSPKGAADA